MSQTWTRILHCLAVAGTLTLLSGAVSLTAQAQGNLTIVNGYGNDVSVGLTGHTPVKFGVFAGDFGSSLAGGPVGYPTLFESYCVDINSAAHLGSAYAVTESSSSGLNRAGQVTWLAENAVYLFSTNPGYTADEQRASLQLAIWNTLYDTDNTVNSGSFYLDTTPLNNEYTLANLYLTASVGKTATGVNNKISDNSGNGYQTLIKANSTPEPGTLAYLSVVGGGCLSLLKRRRRTSGSKRA
jgi:hypothetical protein